jgi:hypothetical protein
MHKFLVFVSIICLLALVGCAATPTTTTLPPIPSATPALPTQTATAVSTVTATPSLPKPAQSPNLQSVNNAEEVFENGTWVVKNADGKVTATWDATENVWYYNAENLTMISGGASKPVSEDPNAEAIVDPGATYSVPEAWMTALPENQVDPNPLVPLGVINQIDRSLGVGTENEAHMRIIEVGVDFRGITPVSNSQPGFTQYVAVFTLSLPDHPDILYTLQIPVAPEFPKLVSWIQVFK